MLARQIVHESSQAECEKCLCGWSPYPCSISCWNCSKPSDEQIINYDYTFTTPYKGTVQVLPQPLTDQSAATSFVTDGSASHTDTNNATPPASRSSAVAAVATADVQTNGQDNGQDAVNNLELVSSAGPGSLSEGQSDANKNPPRWVPCEDGDSTGIDWELLRRRDPILFTDEVLLYEDELADSGIAMLSARVRVMPACWFVLLRFWMRVDGALLRLRDTRVFCRLKGEGGRDRGSDSGEGSSTGVGEVAASASPPESASSGDAESIVSSVAAVSPAAGPSRDAVTVVRECSQCEDSFASLAAVSVVATWVQS